MKPKTEGDIAAKTKSLLERAKTQPSATLSLAEILTRQGKAKDAIARLRAIEPDFQQSYRFHVVLARAYRAIGDAATAKTLLEKACALAPQNEVALRDLLRLHAPALLQNPNAAASAASKSESALALPSFASVKPAGQPSKSVAKAASPHESSAMPPSPVAPPQNAPTIAESAIIEKATADAAKFRVERESKTERTIEAKPAEPSKAEPVIEARESRQPKVPMTIEAKPVEQPKTTQPAAEEKLLTENDIFDESGLFVGEFGANEPAKEMPEISFAPEAKQPPKYESLLDLSQIPAQKEEPPAIELDAPKVTLDRAKLSQVLSRLALSEEKSKTESETSKAQTTDADAAQALVRSDENGKSNGESDARSQTNGAANGLKSEALEEPVMQAAAPAPAPKEPIDEIEALAAELANFKAPPVQETNDPTPVAEQRKPFDDDEEIKAPTRQLAEIFVAQGAFAKAIKVYEALAQKEPHNALLFNIIINGLRAQAK